MRWLKPAAQPFFAERCDDGRQHEERFDRLYAAYVDWLEGVPEPTPSRQGFGRLLTHLGYAKRVSNKDHWVRGLKLRAPCRG